MILNRPSIFKTKINLEKYQRSAKAISVTNEIKIRQGFVEDIKAILPGSVPATQQTPAIPALILVFDSAFPAGVTDPNNVANWNTFFGSTFSSVEISGLEARLVGSSGFNMAASKLVSTGLNYIDDQISCILRIGTYTLAANPNLVTIKLPGLTSIVDGYSFMGSCTDVDNITIYIPSCASIGNTVLDNSVFSSAFGSKTITLTVPASRMTCNSGAPDGDIQYLQANNTVTIVTV
jgi:hypothetical protein